MLEGCCNIRRIFAILSQQTRRDLRVVGGASINISDASWHMIISRNVRGKLDPSNILGGGNLNTTRLVLSAADLFWSNSRRYEKWRVLQLATVWLMDVQMDVTE